MKVIDNIVVTDNIKVININYMVVIDNILKLVTGSIEVIDDMEGVDNIVVIVNIVCDRQHGGDR